MNKNYKTSDTVFSNITSIFGSSVILIRISGKFEDITTVCKAFNIKQDLKHKECFLTKIYFEGKLLDEPLITFFQSPHSFTGEDCLEIAIHGSRFIFNKVSEVLIKNGLRFAENGEFSYRAFLNGKMNLVEAEGMASLIASETDLQHRVSVRQFEGKMNKNFENLRDSILEILANIESLIDFSDEDLPPEIITKQEEKIENIKQEIKKHLENSSILSLQEGLKLAIIGRPNAGKSSIFNRLIGMEKAIVSSIAGTTRDIIEERIIIKDVPITIYDTAGIRTQTKDEIEIEGIKRAKNILSKSDIKLLVKSADAEETFEDLAKELNLTIDENTILAINKTDLISNNKAKVLNYFYLSASSGEGFEILLNAIGVKIEENFLPLINGAIISSERQKVLLSESLETLSNFSFFKEIELASEDLRITAKKLQSIIGTLDTEDILGNIFSKFCIGK